MTFNVFDLTLAHMLAASIDYVYGMLLFQT